MGANKLFASQWDSFARLIPADASEIQVQDMRRAFYSGGVSLFYTVINMLSDDQEPTEADLRAMDGLKAEFDEYERDLREGRA